MIQRWLYLFVLIVSFIFNTLIGNSNQSIIVTGNVHGQLDPCG